MITIRNQAACLKSSGLGFPAPDDLAILALPRPLFVPRPDDPIRLEEHASSLDLNEDSRDVLGVLRGRVKIVRKTHIEVADMRGPTSIPECVRPWKGPMSSRWSMSRKKNSVSPAGPLSRANNKGRTGDVEIEVRLLDLDLLSLLLVARDRRLTRQ